LLVSATVPVVASSESDLEHAAAVNASTAARVSVERIFMVEIPQLLDMQPRRIPYKPLKSLPKLLVS
jgi:hypothetical protein